MKLTVWIAGVWLAFAVAASAQSLDDQYVRIYTLIQQGDAFLDARQVAGALDKYTEAEAGLKKFQASYPNWNEKVVSFRLRYVTEKLAAAQELAAKTPSVPAAKPGVAATPGTAPAPGGPGTDARAIAAPYEEQIRRLQSERTALEAKLREVLSARPAAADPAEFTKAQERIRLLQKENEILRVSLGQEKERVAKAADPALVEQIRAALADSTRKLSAQADVIVTLRKENESLQTRLQNNPELAQLRQEKESLEARLRNNPEVTQLRTENQSLQKEIRELKLNPNLTSAAGDIAKQLAEAKSQLLAQQQRIDTLLTEKSAVEGKLRELSARPAPQPAAQNSLLSMTEARALNDKIVALEKDLAGSRQSMADSAAALEKLQREKSALVAKVAEYALNSAMSPAGKTAPAATTPAVAVSSTLDAAQLTNRIDVLRARIEILEARQVPYTAEEVALFRAPEKISPAVAKSSEKSSRMLPAGAATLVSQAERAFNERRLDDASKLYEQVVKMDNRNVYTLANLAAIQLEKGELADAEANLTRALAEAPTDAYSVSLMGIAKFRQSKFDDALNYLSRAAQMEPNNPETQNYLGVALSQKGLRGPAETALRRAVQLSPGYASAHHNLAVVYVTAQPPSVELARFHYNKAIASGHPKNEELEKVLTAKAAN